MGSQGQSQFAVEYRPEEHATKIPRDLEEFLLSSPDVAGFRREGPADEMLILVMVKTAQAGARLPQRFGPYILKPVVTGEIHAY